MGRSERNVLFRLVELAELQKCILLVVHSILVVGICIRTQRWQLVSLQSVGTGAMIDRWRAELEETYQAWTRGSE